MSQFVVGLGEVLWDLFPKGKRLGGAPVYTINTRVAWSHIPFTDERSAIAADTKAVCFGSLAQWGRESRASIRESLRRADILKLNEEELYVITQLFGFKMAGEEVLCRRLMRAYSLKMVILTKGVKGASIPEAHALAVRISAYVCTQKGAMPVIPADLLS